MGPEEEEAGGSRGERSDTADERRRAEDGVGMEE